MNISATEVRLLGNPYETGALYLELGILLDKVLDGLELDVSIIPATKGEHEYAPLRNTWVKS